MATTTKTDSPISRSIVNSFIDFLNSVEPAPGVDREAIEVAKDCLLDAFKLNNTSSDDIDHTVKLPSLVDLFSSLLLAQQQQQLELQQQQIRSDSTAHAAQVPRGVPVPPSSSSTLNATDAASASGSESSALPVDDWTSKNSTLGISKDELLGQYFAALEKINFLNTSTDGRDDSVQIDKATRFFQDALAEMERSECETYTLNNLADSLKTQGNKAMQSKLYLSAIELYTCAMSLCDSNAVYYCNRAAALTQVHLYNEAIVDCQKSIEIDPRYSKAYSRLGLAYYAQGKYENAIEKGFKKALLLDPSNESVKENIRMAAHKLQERLQRADAEGGQNPGSGSHSNSESHSHSTSASWTQTSSSPFTSMQFDATSMGFPPDIARMFNMTPNSQETSENSTGFNTPIVPEINLNFGDQMPQGLSGALRSVMNMFPGAAIPTQGNPQDNAQRTTPN